MRMHSPDVNRTRWRAERDSSGGMGRPSCGFLDPMMRRWASAACVAALAVVVGCGDGTDATAWPPAAVEAGPRDGAEPPETVSGAGGGLSAAVSGDGAGEGGLGSLSDGGGGAGVGGVVSSGGVPDLGAGEGLSGAADDAGPPGAVGEAVGSGVVDAPGPLFVFGGDGDVFFELGFLPRQWPDQYSALGEWGAEQQWGDVAVRMDSVLVREGVLRGLVQNTSFVLWARGVSVSVGDGRWVSPLTVQPSEVVPFVIEGYEGPSDPGEIAFEVAAVMAPEPDPGRSFIIVDNPGHIVESWDLLQTWFPNFAGDIPPEGASEVNYYQTIIQLREPDSHPSIADEVMAQTIGDLRVYLTKMDDDGRVLDVRELVPYLWTVVGFADDGSEIWGFPRVDRIPFTVPDMPDEPGEPSRGFLVGFMHDSPHYALTVGGAYGAE